MKKLFSITLAFSLIFLSGYSVSAKSINENENADLINLYEENTNIAQVLSYNNKSLNVTKDDIYLMAQVVYAESCAEPYDGKVAVASVIINRLFHPQFPKTVEGVIKQKGAFSCIRDGKIDVIPNSDCYNAVLEALKGKDPTGEAIFFYNPRTATSKWMKNVSKDNIKPIGNHVFFVVNK
jgi:N-acetylmuramoyl-L-alanine amidase